MKFSESEIEDVALEWLESLGWNVAHVSDFAPDTLHAERVDYGQVVLKLRLHGALERLNLHLPAQARDDAFRKLTRPKGSTL